MRQLESARWRQFLNNPPLMISFLLVVDSLHFVFARLLHEVGMSPDAGALFVLGTAAIQLLIISLLRGRLSVSLFRENASFFISIGLMVALSTFMNYAAVAWINPGTAAMLGKTSVLFGLLLGIIWLKERLRRIELMGSAVAIAGVVVISFQPSDLLQLGSLIVLGSTFLYSLHAAVVKRFGGQMDMIEFLFFRLACTAGFLFLITALQGNLIWPSLEVWGVVLLAATIDVVISRGLYYLALRILDLSFHSIILTMSPVVTVLWTLALFGELPSLQELLGGSIVLAGVLVVTLSQTRRTFKTRETAQRSVELKRQ